MSMRYQGATRSPVHSISPERLPSYAPLHCLGQRATSPWTNAVICSSDRR